MLTFLLLALGLGAIPAASSSNPETPQQVHAIRLERKGKVYKHSWLAFRGNHLAVRYQDNTETDRIVIYDLSSKEPRLVAAWTAAPVYELRRSKVDLCLFSADGRVVYYFSDNQVRARYLRALPWAGDVDVCLYKEKAEGVYFEHLVRAASGLVQGVRTSLRCDSLQNSE